MSVYIGTSGWSYEHWQGLLYPQATRPWERLGYYVQAHPTVELNSSFYRWPTLSAFKSWRQRLPYGFVMSVKAPRLLTHGKRLYGPEGWMERIKASWHQLGEKRAVVLFQLSPKFAFDYERLRYFLQQLPAWMRIAMEFRHDSWHQECVFQLLEQYGAAYCIMSGAGLPCVLRATAPFVYVRMHGPDPYHLYGGSYSNDDLRWWAARIKEWEGRDVYVYFNNDGGGHAHYNARDLRHILASI